MYYTPQEESAAGASSSALQQGGWSAASSPHLLSHGQLHLLILVFCHLTLKLKISLKFCSSYLLNERKFRDVAPDSNWCCRHRAVTPHGAVPHLLIPHMGGRGGGLFCPTSCGFSPQTICLLYSPCERRMPARVHWFINRVGNRNPSLLSFPVRNLFLQYAF